MEEAGVTVPLLKPQSSEADALRQKLDDLFERYLNLLDKYETHRKTMAAKMSAGFMCLAQANFTTQSRMRYGQDFYDERMRAQRKVMLSSTDDFDQFSIDHEQEPLPLQQNSEKIGKQADGEEKPSHDSERELPHLNAIAISKDPIRWFGIFVPQDLRNAQTHFTSAVDECVGQLTTTQRELARLTIEIKRTRKQFGRLISSQFCSQST